MSFFVSESIKSIIDENTLLANDSSEKKVKHCSLSLIFRNIDDTEILYDIKKVNFENSESVDIAKIDIICNPQQSESLFFKKFKNHSMRIGKKLIKINTYEIKTIEFESKDVYKVRLICALYK
tara:strand:+ start:910 stop:1278 length:369 start_codon:yes stop_codon:yes gene_type:complete